MDQDTLPQTPSTAPENRGPEKTGIFQRLDRSAHYPYSFNEYARRFAWEWVQCTLIRWSPRRAYRWRRFWLGLFGAKLGAHSSIKPTTTIVHPWLLTIGAHSILSERVVVYNLGPVTVGEHTVVSQDVYICAGSHDHTKADLPLTRPPISIGSGVWVCAGAFVGPGVSVGDNSVVGARAVVVKDVPAGVIVGGNPAQVLKDRPMVRE